MSFYRTSTQPPKPKDNDAEIQHGFTDSISSLAFSGQADYLAATSWDNSVRVYEVNSTGQAQQRATYTHERPVLSVCWSKDGSKVISGGADNAARMFDTTTGQTTQVAVHDAPIKAVRWIDAQGGILATGSWDKTIKYWDLRTANAVGTITLPERIHSMDVRYPLMAVATADRQVHNINLSSPGTIAQVIASPLKMQTRVVSCLPDGDGWSIGSIEGRAGIHHLSAGDTSKNFTFRCHREDSGTSANKITQVHAVNDMSWHPTRKSVFTTCGSDGSYSFWDKDVRARLKQSDRVPAPISSTTFNRDGTIFAYAISYDWGKGHTGATPDMQSQTKLMLHPVKEDELSRKK